jgi:hypothetical protein
MEGLMGNVKGTGWLSVKEFFQKKIGDEKLNQLIAKLDETDQKALSKLVLPSSWVDYKAHINFLLKADEVYGKKDGVLIAEANVYAAQKDFSGIYKFLLSLLSPGLIVKSTGLLWKSFYDQGEAKSEKPNATTMRLIISNFPDIPLHHELENTPYIEEMMRMAGTKNPKGRHTHCIARGDAQCIWEFSWPE